MAKTKNVQLAAPRKLRDSGNPHAQQATESSLRPGKRPLEASQPPQKRRRIGPYEMSSGEDDEEPQKAIAPATLKSKKKLRGNPRSTAIASKRPQVAQKSATKRARAAQPRDESEQSFRRASNEAEASILLNFSKSSIVFSRPESVQNPEPEEDLSGPATRTRGVTAAITSPHVALNDHNEVVQQGAIGEPVGGPVSGGLSPSPGKRATRSSQRQIVGRAPVANMAGKISTAAEAPLISKRDNSPTLFVSPDSSVANEGESQPHTSHISRARSEGNEFNALKSPEVSRHPSQLHHDDDDDDDDDDNHGDAAQEGEGDVDTQSQVEAVVAAAAEEEEEEEGEEAEEEPTIADRLQQEQDLQQSAQASQPPASQIIANTVRTRHPREIEPSELLRLELDHLNLDINDEYDNRSGSAIHLKRLFKQREFLLHKRPELKAPQPGWVQKNDKTEAYPWSARVSRLMLSFQDDRILDDSGREGLRKKLRDFSKVQPKQQGEPIQADFCHLMIPCLIRYVWQIQRDLNDGDPKAVSEFKTVISLLDILGYAVDIALNLQIRQSKGSAPTKLKVIASITRALETVQNAANQLKVIYAADMETRKEAARTRKAQQKEQEDREREQQRTEARRAHEAAKKAEYDRAQEAKRARSARIALEATQRAEETRREQDEQEREARMRRQQYAASEMIRLERARAERDRQIAEKRAAIKEEERQYWEKINSTGPLQRHRTTRNEATSQAPKRPVWSKDEIEVLLVRLVDFEHLINAARYERCRDCEELRQRSSEEIRQKALSMKPSLVQKYQDIVGYIPQWLESIN